MGFIDLTVEKPAWKRTEVVESADATDTPEEENSTVAEEIAVEEAAESETESCGRFARTVRVAGGLVVAGVSLLTLRKLRSRQSEPEQSTPDIPE